MSAKTEQASDKKKRDARKRGQVLRSPDLISIIVLAGMTALLTEAISLAPIMGMMLDAAQDGFPGKPETLAVAMAWETVKRVLAMFGCAVMLSALPTLLMSRFSVGSEVIRLDFNAISPLTGLKRLFNLRNAKDIVKSCLYFVAFALVGWAFWHAHRIEIMSLAYMSLPVATSHMRSLLGALAYSVLAASCLLVIGDLLASYLLHLKELKMTRAEVKTERKNDEGSAEIKQERKRMAHELLPNTTLRDVEKSNFMVANPTHIAIGFYINPHISALPFISVMETDERALAALAHARANDVPVIRHIPLARRIFSTHKRYSFVSDDSLMDIVDILQWLMDVEASRRLAYEAPTEQEEEQPGSSDEASADPRPPVD